MSEQKAEGSTNRPQSSPQSDPSVADEIRSAVHIVGGDGRPKLTVHRSAGKKGGVLKLNRKERRKLIAENRKKVQ